MWFPSIKKGRFTGTVSASDRDSLVERFPAFVNFIPCGVRPSGVEGEDTFNSIGGKGIMTGGADGQWKKPVIYVRFFQGLIFSRSC